jgi:hypothetical protein
LAPVATTLWKGYLYEPKRGRILASARSHRDRRVLPSALCVEPLPGGGSSATLFAVSPASPLAILRDGTE